MFECFTDFDYLYQVLTFLIVAMVFFVAAIVVVRAGSEPLVESLSLPSINVALLADADVSESLPRTSARLTLRQRFGFALCFLLNFMYFPLAVRTLSVFRCNSATVINNAASNSIIFLQAAPYLRCFSALHTVATAAAGISVGVLLIGIPAFFLANVWRFRYDLDSSPLRQELGFLWAAYRIAWWPIVPFACKLCIAASLTQFQNGDIFTPATIWLMLQVLIVLQLAFRPLVRIWENAVSVLLLVVAQFSYTSSILAGIGGGNFSDASSVQLADVAASVNLAVKGCMVCLLLRWTVLENCEWRSKGAGETDQARIDHDVAM